MIILRNSKNPLRIPSKFSVGYMHNKAHRFDFKRVNRPDYTRAVYFS